MRLRGALVIIAVSVAAALLWPLPTSPRWEITANAEAMAGKTGYLESVATHTPSARPNVLLLVADDLGQYDISQSAPAAAATPNIDALAQDGVSFSNAYATAAICAPSRAALLTGRYQNRFGFESQPMQRYVRNLGEFLGFRFIVDTDAMRPFLLGEYPNTAQRRTQGLPQSEITLAEVFDAVGYETAIVGKWHLGYDQSNHPQKFGFDFQYGFMEAFTLYADEAEPGIENHYHDLFWEQHIWDMQRSGPSAITRNGLEITEDRYLTDAIVAETKAFIAGAHERGQPFFAYVPFSAPHTPFQARREDVAALGGAGDHNHRVYLAMIRRLDWAVGELLQFLKDRGELENTVVVFTSDNGGAAYTGATDNGPLRGGKFSQFEGGLKVPLTVRWGARTEPDVVEQPVLLTDLFATLLARLGLPLAADRAYDSVDLLAASRTSQPRHLFWRSDFNRATRYGQWKLLHNKRDQTVMLFNIEQDAGERMNVAGDHPEIVTELMAALDAWEQEMRQPLWPRVMNYRHSDDIGSHWFAI
jgi:arylsulfatase A-like enzyme